MKMRAFLFLLVCAAAGLIVGFTLSHSVHALIPPQLAAVQAAVDPQAASAGHRFMSDAGIMLKFIKPDRTADFEATVDKLQEALARSSNRERRRQALSWRVFRAAGTATNGDAVYVFEMNPAVRGADYTVAKILAEAFPDEAQSLYQRYGDATSTRQHVVDLKLIAALGEEPGR